MYDVLTVCCADCSDAFALMLDPEEVCCVAQTLDGTRISITAAGFGARVLQHEIDHLNGVLFIDKIVGPSEQQQHEGGDGGSSILPPLPTR